MGHIFEKKPEELSGERTLEGADGVRALLGEPFVAGAIIWGLFGKVRVILDPDRLRVEKTALGVGRRRSVERSAIREIHQCTPKNTQGGRWDLMVRAGEDLKVLGDDNHERTTWFGRVLAVWSGATFTVPPEQ